MEMKIFYYQGKGEKLRDFLKILFVMIVLKNLAHLT
jgi:hypothetical protein